MRGSVGIKWHDLRIELLDSNDVGESNTIDAEYPSDLNKCCTKMFVVDFVGKETAYSIMEPVNRSLKTTWY